MAVSNTERFKRQSLESWPYITLHFPSPMFKTWAEEVKVSPHYHYKDET